MFVRCLIVIAVLLAVRSGLSDDRLEFSEVEQIAWPEQDLFERMMDGAHQFVERKIHDAQSTRPQYWKYDFSSKEGWPLTPK